MTKVKVTIPEEVAEHYDLCLPVKARQLLRTLSASRVVEVLMGKMRIANLGEFSEIVRYLVEYGMVQQPNAALKMRSHVRLTAYGKALSIQLVSRHLDRWSRGKPERVQ